MGSPKYEKLKAISSITVRGKRYRFALKKNLKKHQEACGLTDPPNKKGKAVLVDPDQTPKEMLATLIDEFIHCAIWELDNQVVDEISDNLAHALWRCGLRFVDECQD
jgi:2,3-bisphosphoglycerate-independent phosphoglycerate mutase